MGDAYRQLNRYYFKAVEELDKVRKVFDPNHSRPNDDLVTMAKEVSNYADIFIEMMRFLHEADKNGEMGAIHVSSQDPTGLKYAVNQRVTKVSTFQLSNGSLLNCVYYLEQN